MKSATKISLSQNLSQGTHNSNSFVLDILINNHTASVNLSDSISCTKYLFAMDNSELDVDKAGWTPDSLSAQY